MLIKSAIKKNHLLNFEYFQKNFSKKRRSIVQKESIGIDFLEIN